MISLAFYSLHSLGRQVLKLSYTKVPSCNNNLERFTEEISISKAQLILSIGQESPSKECNCRSIICFVQLHHNKVYLITYLIFSFAHENPPVACSRSQSVKESQLPRTYILFFADMHLCFYPNGLRVESGLSYSHRVIVHSLSRPSEISRTALKISCSTAFNEWHSYQI